MLIIILYFNFRGREGGVKRERNGVRDSSLELMTTYIH